MDLVRLLAVVFAWSLTVEGESIASCAQGEGLKLINPTVSARARARGASVQGNRTLRSYRSSACNTPAAPAASRPQAASGAPGRYVSWGRWEEPSDGEG